MEAGKISILWTWQDLRTFVFIFIERLFALYSKADKACFGACPFIEDNTWWVLSHLIDNTWNTLLILWCVLSTCSNTEEECKQRACPPPEPSMEPSAMPSVEVCLFLSHMGFQIIFANTSLVFVSTTSPHSCHQRLPVALLRRPPRLLHPLTCSIRTKPM